MCSLRVWTKWITRYSCGNQKLKTTSKLCTMDSNKRSKSRKVFMRKKNSFLIRYIKLIFLFVNHLFVFLIFRNIQRKYKTNHLIISKDIYAKITWKMLPNVENIFIKSIIFDILFHENSIQNYVETRLQIFDFITVDSIESRIHHLLVSIEYSS